MSSAFFSHHKPSSSSRERTQDCEPGMCGGPDDALGIHHRSNGRAGEQRIETTEPYAGGYANDLSR